MTALPRLYVNGAFQRIVHPISVSITQNIIPLSTATMTLPRGDELPSRSYVELFTPYGSAGMFRVRSPHNSYGLNYSTAELEHMIAEVGDYCVKAEYSEMIDAGAAVSIIFSHYNGKRWRLGSLSGLSGSVALEAKYDSVLNALLSILEQKPEYMMAFDFSTNPWTLNIVKRGTTVVAEGRLGRNVTTATVTVDDSELSTRVWYQLFYEDEEGNKTSTWASRDADTISKYGVIESRINTSSDMNPAEVEQTVNAYIRDHKHPKTSVDIEMDELFQITGERMDKAIIGDLYRLNLVDYGMTVELNVTSVSWNNVYNTSSALVHLGAEEDSVVTFLHNLDATGSGVSGGSGGGGGGKKQDNTWKEYRSMWSVTDDKIEGVVQRVDRSDNILEQAGLQLTSQGVLIYADNGTENTLSAKFKVTNDKISTEVKNRTDADAALSSSITQTATQIQAEVTRAKTAENTLSGRVTVNANKVSMVVTETAHGYAVNSASIVAGINSQSGSYVQIQADKINLSGYVTASDLAATNAAINNLITGGTTASVLKATSCYFGRTQIDGSLYMGSSQCSLQSITINGQPYHLLGYLG